VVRRGLSPAALDRVRETVAPEARVTRTRPLHGGVSSTVHVVHLAGPNGKRQAVVVRRYGAYAQKYDRGACEREFRILELLTEFGQPVPRPLLLETAESAFETPTIVMERVVGRPMLAPRDLADYLRQLAETLLALHQLPTEPFDFLPDTRWSVERALRAELTPRGDPLQDAVWQTAHSLWPELKCSQRTLVHGDYWPGNVLWRRGRLISVLDWEISRVGDPTKDVATCRGDLTVLFGLEVADAFVAAYQTAGGQVENLRFWDLLVSTWAVREMVGWAVAYPLLGRRDITPALACERIRIFARAALDATMGG
jgi:aminoglycoside phosphotransferase (APT) family kinase protein